MFYRDLFIFVHRKDVVFWFNHILYIFLFILMTELVLYWCFIVPLYLYDILLAKSEREFQDPIEQVYRNNTGVD